MAEKQTVSLGGETADIQFYDPVVQDHRRIKFDHKLMWAGNHKMCRHAQGVCVSPKAWILEHGTWRLKPRLVPTSIEERHMGMIEFPGQKGKYPQATQIAKGMLDWDEEQLGHVRPTQEVAEWHYNRNLKELQTNLGRRQAKYSEIKHELAERRRELDAANTDVVRPAPKASSDGDGDEKPKGKGKKS